MGKIINESSKIFIEDNGTVLTNIDSQIFELSQEDFIQYIGDMTAQYAVLNTKDPILESDTILGHANEHAFNRIGLDWYKNLKSELELK